MKNMKNVICIALAVSAAVLTGCSKGEPVGGARVESAQASLKQTVNGSVGVVSRAVNQQDPTATAPGDRTGHVLKVTLGGRTADFSYDGAKWVPEGIAPTFPGFAPADVTFSLAPASVSDPVSMQDGTVTGLLGADVLTGKLVNQTPVNDLPAVALTHVNALLDFEVSGYSAEELDTRDVKVNDKFSCRIPADGVKYQHIVDAGSGQASIIIGDYLALVSAADGAFKANTRYKFKVVLSSGDPVRIENIRFEQWSEGESGSGTATSP